VPRGERVRQGPDIVHARRAVPAVRARVPRGLDLRERHSGPVEAGEAAGLRRRHHGLRARLPDWRRRPTGTGGRGLGPVHVHDRSPEVRVQVRDNHANRGRGRRQRSQCRPRGVHQRWR